jgi:peptide-methionine (R)-S-oxide reductase
MMHRGEWIVGLLALGEWDMPRILPVIAVVGVLLFQFEAAHVVRAQAPSDPQRSKSADPKDESAQPQQGAVSKSQAKPKSAGKTSEQPRRVVHSDRQWRSLLTPDQYYVLRRKGTEPAFSGKYWDNHEDGIYACAGCGSFLFDSRTKFESGTGWPSYWSPLNSRVVKTRADISNGTMRTEVNCRVCDGHLGHVFDDGPAPTGLRYCMNSVSLSFLNRKEAEAKIREEQERREGAEPAKTEEPKKDTKPPSTSESPEPKSKAKTSGSDRG